MLLILNGIPITPQIMACETVTVRGTSWDCVTASDAPSPPRYRILSPETFPSHRISFALLALAAPADEGNVGFCHVVDRAP